MNQQITSAEQTELAVLMNAQKQIDDLNGLAKTVAAKKVAAQYGPGWKTRLSELAAGVLDDWVGKLKAEDAQGGDETELDETDGPALTELKAAYEAASGIEKTTLFIRGKRLLGPGWTELEGSSIDPEMFKARNALEKANGVHKAALAAEYKRRWGKDWKSKLPAPDPQAAAEIVPPGAPLKIV